MKKNKIKSKLIMGIIFLSINAFSQNWVGSSGNNTMYAVNASQALSPLKLGIGTNAPSHLLHINGTSASGQMYISGNGPGISLGNNLSPTSATIWGTLGLATSSNHYGNNTIAGDLILNVAVGKLRFITGGTQTVQGNIRMTIDQSGKVGIAQTNPTAALHVNCTGIPTTGVSNIRFENLQQGTGNYLVIDANGYVRRSASISPNKIKQDEIEIIKTELQQTKQELMDLKSQIQAMIQTEQSPILDLKSVNKNILEIFPTPFSDNARVVYSIEGFTGKAILQLMDETGTLLKTFSIYQAKGEIELGNININSHAIIFTIIAEGKNIISKKSIKM